MSITRSDQPVLSDEQVVANAKAISPTLVARQAETEQRTYYAADTHEAFRDAGFYGMLLPKRYGGHEFSLDTYFRVVREIARGCPSTGWMLSQSINHTITVASFMSEQAQDEIFGGGEFLAPATANPQGRARRADDGGWIINGTFNYCSGAPYSTHLLAHAIPEDPARDGVPAGPMMFVAPRDTYTILEDWGDVLGLKGSGSHSIRFDDAYLPEHLVLPGETMLSLDPKAAIGRELHGNSMYAGSTFTFYLLGGSNVAVGTAMGALDEYESLLMAKKIPSPPFTPRTQDGDYQRWFGTAVGLLATAEAAVNDYGRQWADISERGAWTRDDDLRMAGICREVVNNLAWNAMQTVVRTAGSSSIRAGHRMERVWRDYSQLYSHGWAFLHDVAARDLARERAGAAETARNDWSPTFTDRGAA
jgi:3-hydroxy-9,10-secoandrosta-1,3,5(10)-triene-9,17-dione monooxygenase